MKKSIRFILVLLCLITVLLSIGCGSSRENRVVYTSVEDLNGKRVGVILGSLCEQTAKKLWDDCELVYFNSDADMVIALESGKIDCLMEDDAAMRLIFVNNSNICQLGDMLEVQDYALIFSKDEKGIALCNQFNEYLASIENLEEVFSQMQDIWYDPDTSVHPYLDYESLPATNGTLQIAATMTYQPFEYVENNHYAGFELEIIYNFCKQYGYAMKMNNVSFSSVLAGISTGKYDIGCNGLTITAERAESVSFSNVINHGGPVVAIRTENSVPGNTDSEENFFVSIADSFNKTFFVESRWQLFAKGIARTFLITLISLICGTLIGFLLYIYSRHSGKIFKKVMNFFSCLITGMPEVVLLMIMFYIIFGKTDIDGMWVSSIAFSIIVCVNVFSMVTNGVAAIDRGQSEAALAIGYSEWHGFFRMILPQALQHIMPNYNAMIISLLKATAIVGYISVEDLTKIGDIVRSRTYQAFFPLIATAVIYYILAWLILWIVKTAQKNLMPIRNSKEKILKGINIGK